MMPPQIFKSVNFTKTQKSRYFKNKTFFLQKKKKKKGKERKKINCTSRATLC